MDIGGAPTSYVGFLKKIYGVTLNETGNKSNLGRGSWRLAMCSRFYFVDDAPKGRVTSFRNKNKLGWVEPHLKFHPGFPINLPFGVLVLFCTSCLCKLGTHNLGLKRSDKWLQRYSTFILFWGQLLLEVFISSLRKLYFGAIALI